MPRVPKIDRNGGPESSIVVFVGETHWFRRFAVAASTGDAQGGYSAPWRFSSVTTGSETGTWMTGSRGGSEASSQCGSRKASTSSGLGSIDHTIGSSGSLAIPALMASYQPRIAITHRPRGSRSTPTLGKPDAATLAAEELRITAATVKTDALRAMSAVADSVLAEVTEVTEASALLHEAVQSYHKAGLRHDEAGTRLLLATSLLAQGDTEAARDHIACATDVMTDLADTAGLTHAGELAQSLDARATCLLTPREQEVLRLISRGMRNDESLPH